MRIGVQLQPWLRENPQPALTAVLAEVRQAGCLGIEAGAQFFEWNRPQDLLELTRNASLQVAGIHTGTEIYDPQTVSHARVNLPVIAAFSHQIGAACLIYSGILIENKPFAEMDAELEAIQTAAYQCADLGVPFCYYNHWWEITDSFRELRYYRDHTDPQLVSFCLDLGWVHRAGHEPIEAIELLGERIRYVHLRDESTQKEWCGLGHGVINLPAVFQSLVELNPDWVILDPEGGRGSPYEYTAAAREYIAAVVAGW